MEPAKVLIIEDEPFLRDLYIDTLSPEGYRLDSASDGEQALQKMREGGWNLILLDIILPKMSAFQIMETLSNDQDFKSTNTAPIVFLTNLDNDSDIKKALDLGGAGYLIKSQITPGDLIREVKMYLQKKRNTDNPEVPQTTNTHSEEIAN